MPLLKRKPVLYHPLPSLSSVLQPIASSTKDNDLPSGTGTPPPPPSVGAAVGVGANGKGKKKKQDLESEIGDEDKASSSAWIAPDADNDNDQLALLSRVFEGGFVTGKGQVVSKGKKSGTIIVNGPVNWSGDDGGAEEDAANAPGVPGGNTDVKVEGLGHANGNGDQIKVEGEGEMAPPPAPTPAQHAESWKITDTEVYYIPETGEIFIDYDSYLARMNFYQQPLYQCEVSGKSSLSYFAAYANERKEIRQLHTRFPKQLKKAVLTAVQFQVEGKLETLADKIYERFQNRFFDDEKVFVDVQGDKYLARIVKTFPPRSLANSPLKSKVASTGLKYHTHAANLSLDNEDVLEQDDPMKYFYSARLLVEGADHGYSQAGEAFEGSVMEVQADKISRDRINFSRAMLKRFIRDCVYREAAVYSPWIVKPSVAARYAIPTEMTDEIKDEIANFREAQMDRRKREREERLGIMPEEEPERGRKKAKKEKGKEEEVVKVEEDVKKRPMKYPAEDFLVEYTEKDEKEGRIEVRPAPSKALPFGDQFEKLLLCWSFLNVMGKPLGLSPFTLDEFESSLYHKDPWTSPPPLMTEIHSCLINTLIRDLQSGAEPVRALASTSTSTEDQPDSDYWEGLKGATTETLRPIATELASTWSTKLLSARDRKGWESALVGLLWERGSLASLPTYLDHILHLTFEDKPAPTRPTWSTGPSTSGGAGGAGSVPGLVPSKPEKRWSTLHHTHKLDIIGWVIEMVVQTGAVRDFMEESTAALTEVRKEQIDVKREWKRIQAELLALEPKKEAGVNGDEGEGEAEVDAEGDTHMSNPEESRTASSPALGTANGDGEEDELEDTPPPSEPDAGDDDLLTPPTSPPEHAGAAIAGAARRQAMASKAASRAEEESARLARLKAEREISKAKKSESKALSTEKRRLLEEEEASRKRLRELEYEFRAHIYTLRSRPFGVDRYGNKIWWMDGIGSAPLVPGGDGSGFGTGRIYVQGVEEGDLGELITLAEIAKGEVEQRREKEEGEGKLAPGEWGVYDTPEQLSAFISYLNPRGTRDALLLKSFKTWLPEIEGGMRRRRIVAGLEKGADEERRRPTRRVAGGEEEGYMGWRNKRVA